MAGLYTQSSSLPSDAHHSISPPLPGTRHVNSGQVLLSLPQSSLLTDGEQTPSLTLSYSFTLGQGPPLQAICFTDTISVGPQTILSSLVMTLQTPIH